jgi:hypothetical protein
LVIFVEKKSILRLKQEVFCILFLPQNFKRIKDDDDKIALFWYNQRNDWGI